MPWSDWLTSRIYLVGVPTHIWPFKTCFPVDTREPAATNFSALIRACARLSLQYQSSPHIQQHTSRSVPIGQLIRAFRCMCLGLNLQQIVPSWTLLFSPMRISSISQRSSQLYQISLAARILISPMMLAVGAIKAELKISGGITPKRKNIFKHMYQIMKSV